jgi:signal transduction histidine kinase
LKFENLKTSVLIWFGGVITVLLLVFSISFYYFFNKSIKLSLETKLQKEAFYIHDTILPKLKKSQIIKNGKFSSIEIAIIKNKKIINQTKNFKLNQFFKRSDKFFTVDYGENIKAYYRYNFKNPFNGSLFIIKKNIDDKAENIVDTLLYLDPILLLILLFLGNKLINKILIPIRNVTNIANNITITNFSRTIPMPKNGKEIKDLVDSFNKMIKRLKNGVESIDRFNSDVSHELKTPLTVIQGEIDVTLKKPREPEYYEKSLDTISYETKQIKKIVDDLLLLSKFSKENAKDTFESCSIDQILLLTIEEFSKIAKVKNIKLQIDKIEPILSKVNPFLIERIFSNLIDNAIKYTPNYKNIYISLYQDEKIHFIVKDEGIGIPKDKLSFITDRFYRVDESRNKKIKGFGLGLSIVKNSVELHGGVLHVSSKIDEETIMEVEL